ncbi:urease accessory protein UreD [Pedobacter sp. PLR]|uniref:urease accessory protein UreD n=1 Tax=Pedobacter sp. PLR TaxID=2994465 RepID=UPI0022460BD0|nr:urease accessory protein UreD [Pedobacter sp. PLR]MCX2454243.1 urease accessory protein UreD [Pedobacter sp. PLR]
MESAIKISVCVEDDNTVLKDSYYNMPYKVVPYGSQREHQHLELIIMSSSPGIMDEDHLKIDIEVGDQATLHLYSQSYNKLHPMKTGATQQTEVKVGEGAFFQYIPYPITPFKDSIFKTLNEIHLAKGASLLWGDIICAGRVSRDEIFQFEKLHSTTKIYQEGKLRYVDNQVLKPKDQPIDKMLFHEGYTHQATLIFAADCAAEFKKELDEIFNGEYEDITFGFTMAANQMILLRALGNNGDLLYNFMRTVANICMDFMEHKKPVAELT